MPPEMINRMRRSFSIRGSLAGALLLTRLGQPSRVLRDAPLRAAPQDEGKLLLSFTFSLILRSRRRRRLEGRTMPPRRPRRALSAQPSQGATPLSTLATL